MQVFGTDECDSRWKRGRDLHKAIVSSDSSEKILTQQRAGGLTRLALAYLGQLFAQALARKRHVGNANLSITLSRD